MTARDTTLSDKLRRMSSRLLSDRARLPSVCLGVVAALTLGACGDKENGDGTATTMNSSDSTATSSQSTTGQGGNGSATAPTAGDPSASSTGTAPGVTSTSGGTTSNTATTPSTGSPPTGTMSNTGSTSSGTATGTGGSEDPGSTGEGGTASAGGTDDPGTTDDSAEGGSGGEGEGGSGGDEVGEGNGGNGGSGETPSGECTREFLDGLLDDYFAALSAGDPSTLPLAANVKFTENAEESEIGSTDFWMNAGDTKYSQRALDTTACAAAAEAVVPEGTTDLPVALRIKVEAGELTEIETIVVRQGDYTASFAVDSDPDAIIAIADDIGWDDEVPDADRATREELAAWIDKYFRTFPSGVCNVTGDCRRLENGGGNFSCGTGASCSGDSPTSGGVFEPRVIVVDEVRGIAAGFTIFDFMTTGHLDMHMVKMHGGEVYAVHAILRNTNGESGWD